MKRTLYFLSLALVLLVSSNVSMAQKKSNWFVGAGVGANLMYDNHKISPASPAGQLSVGTWFTPSIGFRTTLHGIMGHPADASKTWFSDNTFFGLFQFHVDGMWSFMNTFTSYKSNRVWNPALYLRATGGLATSLGSTKAFAGAGGGWVNQFRLNDFMSIALDLNAIVTNEKLFRTNHGGRFVFLGSATLGVVFDLGTRGF